MSGFYVPMLNLSGDMVNEQVSVYAHADKMLTLDELQNILEEMLEWMKRTQTLKK